MDREIVCQPLHDVVTFLNLAWGLSKGSSTRKPSLDILLFEETRRTLYHPYILLQNITDEMSHFDCKYNLPKTCCALQMLNSVAFLQYSSFKYI